MCDVASSETQDLYLAELAVRRLRGDQQAQRIECHVHAAWELKRYFDNNSIDLQYSVTYHSSDFLSEIRAHRLILYLQYNYECSLLEIKIFADPLNYCTAKAFIYK